ncbi:MAG: glutamate--tRNA ligase family protein, partial [Bacilli bacterium]|nr:glutamate--tRNA ligase family protein [Bacilli bacterium]
FVASLYAKQTNGLCYLRIEDTDQERSIDNGKQIIIDGLSAFGLTFDEGVNGNGLYGPYIQSERINIYKTYVKDLVAQGLAYPCFCSPDELANIRKNQEINKDRIGYYGKFAKCKNLTYEEIDKKIKNHEPYVIRLKSPGNYTSKIECKDLIKGKITFPENDLDIVLLKSNGLPTYHFAHAIDDHLMHTTHVVRGEEWLSSLPVHYQLFKILHFKIPKYAHLSPLTKKDGDSVRKLSKRYDKEASINYYHKLGLPKEALLTYFCTLINANYELWYTQNNQNKPFIFEFSKMTTGGTLFDIDKLLSISKIYFSKMKACELYQDLLAYTNVYETDFYKILTDNEMYSINILNIERNVKKPRKDIALYSDVKNLFWYFYDEYFDIKENKYIDIDVSRFVKGFLNDYLSSCYDERDDKNTWYEKLKVFSQKYNYCPSVKDYQNNPSLFKGHIGDVCAMIRISLTSLFDSPDIYEIMQVMKKPRIEKRFKEFELFLKKAL